MNAAFESDAAWVARRLHEADTAVTSTGVGMSTISGIPNFHGDDSIWGTEFDPASFHRDYFVNSPAGFRRDHVHLQKRIFPDDIEPSPGHGTLSAFESWDVPDAVMMQNIDGLHREVGSGRVVELHGNAAEVVCGDCSARTDTAPVFETVRTGDALPACGSCDGLLKPGAVLFGERLPRVVYDEANRLASDADVFLSLGSSLTVHPAASLASRAAEVGSLAIVNFDTIQCDDRADRVVRGDLVAFPPEVERRI